MYVRMIVHIGVIGFKMINVKYLLILAFLVIFIYSVLIAVIKVLVIEIKKNAKK